MKTHSLSLFFLLVFFWNTTSWAQEKITKIQVVNIITLKATPIANSVSINFTPTVRPDLVDRKLRRRFEYILFNKTDFSSAKYQNAYPDTTQVDKLYHEVLLNSEDVFVYLSLLYQGIKNNTRIEKSVFTKDELLMVASKFFLVTGFLDEKSLDWRVCIGINGQKELNWTKDYTLLEAFSFEAIFENMRSEVKEDAAFMNKFLAYVAEAEKKYVNLDKEQFLKKAKEEIFEKMESDSTFSDILLKYYTANAENLPFIISIDKSP